MLRLTNKRREEASVKRALTLENEIELIEGCRAGKDSARHLKNTEDSSKLNFDIPFFAEYLAYILSLQKDFHKIYKFQFLI